MEKEVLGEVRARASMPKKVGLLEHYSIERGELTPTLR